MCGINGTISLKKGGKEKLLASINKMNDLIVHRGPDDDGLFFESLDECDIAMGMRRLSIIDLNTGKQPIFSDDNNIVIVFNGEIYNFLDLRNDLVKKGVSFSTNSDTEVILKLYESEGVTSFKKLDGMFAFSIYDKIKKKIYIVRDYFGEKPLYYASINNEFYWASELKSLISQLDYKPKISLHGLNLFFRLTYIPAPFTIYDNVHKLESYHYIEYDLKTNKFEILHVEENSQTPNNKIDISFGKAKEEVRKLVYESVVSRSISDVPLGTYLSGGVDSSIVSLCLSQYKQQPIDTFSIGFEKETYDESDKSRLVADLIGSNHHEFIINENDLREDVHDILSNFDEPFSDSSSLPTYLVANRTKKYVKVALTGDGGDEVFGGYNKYYMGKMNSAYTKVIPNNLHKYIQKKANNLIKDSEDSRGKKFKVRRLLDSVNYKGEYYWEIISLGFTSNHLVNFLNERSFQTEAFEYFKSKTGISYPSSLTDYRIIDKNISLEGDMLVKVDRTSMMNSLECRAPFLNKKIWDFTMKLPHQYLLKGWDKKRILKKAFENQFPKGFLDKSKQGFGAPVGDWLRTSFNGELRGYSNIDKITKQGIFNPEAVDFLVNNHISGKEDNSFKVWAFYCFQKWYDNTYEKI